MVPPASPNEWFDAQPLALAVVHVDGRHHRVNPAYCRMLGVEAGELARLSLLDIAHPNDRDRLADVAAPLLDDSTAATCDLRLIRRDGTAVSTTLFLGRGRGADGSMEIHVGVVDTTAHQRSIDEYRRSAIRTLKLLENISDVVTILDDRGRILRTTAGAHYGREMDESIWRPGRELLQLVHADDARTVSDWFALVVSRPEATVTGEARVRTSAERWEAVMFTIVNRIHEPAVGGVVMTSRSVQREIDKDVQLGRLRAEAVERLLDETRRSHLTSASTFGPARWLDGLAAEFAPSALVAIDSSVPDRVEGSGEQIRRALGDLLGDAAVSPGIEFELTFEHSTGGVDLLRLLIAGVPGLAARIATPSADDMAVDLARRLLDDVDVNIVTRPASHREGTGDVIIEIPVATHIPAPTLSSGAARRSGHTVDLTGAGRGPSATGPAD